MKQLLKCFAALFCAVIVFSSFNTLRVDAATDGIPIDKDHFPDAKLRSLLASSTYNKDGNNYLNDYELKRIKNLHCEHLGISTLEGIEYLKYMEGLWCRDNNLTTLDVSKNEAIVGVWCSENKKIQYLDFSKNKNLQWVYCFDCDLRGLNISSNTELGYLECNSNPYLKELNLKGNPKLEHLFASKCGLKKLDLSGNPLLSEVNCTHNDLEYLDVSKNTRLKRLDIWYNKRLTSVDITNLKELEYFNCAWNNMPKIDVTKNPELAELVCSHNEVTELDLSHNPKLAFLVCDCNTKLKKLDLSHNPKLYYLYAYGLSLIDTIDISKNSRLCKVYNEGVYHHDDNIGRVWDKEINYGGSGDPFDQLLHTVAFDDGTKIIGTYNGTNDVPDCYLDFNDGFSGSERFATRQEAIWLLYEMAGAPAVSGSSTFTDVDPNSAFADAIKWGQDNKICLGYPRICDDTFCGNELINREDFALMAHRYAKTMGFGTAFDYGRTDWLKDFSAIDFYGWGAFTWAIQFEVLLKKDGGTMGYPHGRMTWDELEAGCNKIFHLDEAASYADRVSNGKVWTPPKDGEPAKPRTPVPTSGSTTGSNNGSTTGSFTLSPEAAQKFGDFVERLYVVALNRPSEKEGKDYWLELVGNGTLTGADCARFFLTCQEFKDRGLSDEEFLKVLYTTFFDRNAADDPDGFNFWLNSLKTVGKDTVVEGFINSPEWCNICAEFGIRSGAPTAKATKASSNATAFATRLYTECLGREPEQAGLDYWSLGLTNQELTGSQAAHEFFYCKEFNDHGFSNEELLTRMYKTFMGRDPDAEGLKYWLDNMNNGMTKDQVFYSFVQSQEFTGICASYAIIR